MRVLASYNIKGGVGKTSTAVNLAALSAADGLRTLLWDLDPQSAATFLFRIKPKIKGGGRRLVRGGSDVGALVRGTDHEGLDLLPADFSYRHMDLFLDGKKRTARLSKVLRPLAEDYDLVVLDCPPSISLLSENVFRLADALLVPLIPTPLSERTLEQLERFLAEHDLDHLALLPFGSMVDHRKRLHREILEGLRSARTDVLATSIPSASEIERMGIHRDVVTSYAPDGAATRAYRALWNEVRGRLWPPTAD